MKALLLVVLLSGTVLSPAYAVDISTKLVNDKMAVQVKASPKINLNKADVSTLIQSFKGIGKKRAEAIVNYREANGAFKSIEDLALVTGFGKQFISKHLDELQQVFLVE